MCCAWGFVIFIENILNCFVYGKELDCINVFWGVEGGGYGFQQIVRDCQLEDSVIPTFLHKRFLMNKMFYCYDSLMAILNSGTSQFDEGRKKEDMWANGCQETDHGCIHACCTE